MYLLLSCFCIYDPEGDLTMADIWRGWDHLDRLVPSHLDYGTWETIKCVTPGLYVGVAFEELYVEGW